FLFFSDFHGDLARAIRDGRRKEFEGHPGHGHEDEKIPDPSAKKTFTDCKLDWDKPASAEGHEWLELTRALLEIRARTSVPLVRSARTSGGKILEAGDGLVAVSWDFRDGRLGMAINLGAEAKALPALPGKQIYAYPSGGPAGGTLAANAIIVTATAGGKA